MSTNNKETITIIPAKQDVNVPKPDGTKLSSKGEKVTRSAYWVRRLSDGDVVIVEQKAAKKLAVNKGE